jgi:uncharacterized OB-fold protein
LVRVLALRGHSSSQRPDAFDVSSSRPIARGVYTDDERHLIGGRHRASGQIVFPLPTDDEQYEPVALPARGQLWSYTVQRFPPKSPPYAGAEPFEPFAVGYVELPGALIVESRLTGVAFDSLRVGMPMELAIVPFRQDPDGDTVTTFAFRPVAGGGS